ncbi:MAG: 30S ribosomal protein S17, partial [Candidatus Micrarchaeota archaeon]
MTIDSKSNKISTRGFTVQGVVVSDKRKKTVTVQRDLVSYVPKYRRYARKISKIAAHNPDEIGAKLGDLVEIAECRKISKTKAWIVTKIVKKGAGHIIPGQVKARDESQLAHRGKHGGESERSQKHEKSHAGAKEQEGEQEELPQREKRQRPVQEKTAQTSEESQTRGQTATSKEE